MSNLFPPTRTRKPLASASRKRMKEKIFHCSIALSIFLISSTYLLTSLDASPDPLPAPWPVQFHSILFMNNSKGLLRVADLWYDWTNGRNFNIVQTQLGEKKYSLQWNNGTTFYYTDSDTKCDPRQYSVGVLRPNWLDGANYLGQVYQDGFLCNVWEKVDFIWYYEDVETKRPVYWAFSDGIREHVMTFEVGKVLDDPNWQAPAYCFEEESAYETKTSLELDFGLPLAHMGIFTTY